MSIMIAFLATRKAIIERDPKWVIFPRRAYQAHGEINERLVAIAHDFAVEPALAAFNPIVGGGLEPSAPRLGIVAGGVSAAYAREALRMVEARAAERGIVVPAYRFWQVGTPYSGRTTSCSKRATTFVWWTGRNAR